MKFKIIAALLYAVMVFVNYLANALPIGGVTTGEASDAFANLFTPAGLTFSIWGLIYFLLFVYVIYQFIGVKKKDAKLEKAIAKVNKYFVLSSLANVAWIFSWHYQIIWLSVLIMLGLLICLIKIADVLKTEDFTLKDFIAIKLPFSIYFGWITVAIIANITVFLVSINWNGLGIADNIWMIIVLFAGIGIGIWRMYIDRNIAYGLVIVWAYIGILYKHTSAGGFGGQYPDVISALFICLVLLFGGIVLTAHRSNIRLEK
ncbi:MAG: tryptophan-rich sensory protein [Patescibacteria group bacterium]